MASGKGGSSCPSPALTLWLQVDHVSFHESLLPTKQEGPTCFSGLLGRWHEACRNHHHLMSDMSPTAWSPDTSEQDILRAGWSLLSPPPHVQSTCTQLYDLRNANDQESYDFSRDLWNAWIERKENHIGMSWELTFPGGRTWVLVSPKPGLNVSTTNLRKV